VLGQAAKITGFNEFQKAFLSWALDKRQWVLRSPPGKGKSLAATGLFLMLRKKLGSGKLLVVTRTKDFKAFEIANVQKLLLLKLAKEADMCVLYSGYDWPADIYLISDSLLSKVVLHGSAEQKRALTELFSKVNLLVVDEAHSLRVHDSARTKAFLKVSTYYHKLMARSPAKHRLGFLTATPVYKELENYHSIFSCLCMPNPLGSWFQFLDRFCVVEQMASYGNRKMYTRNGSHSYKGQVGYTKIVGYKNMAELNALINPYIFSWDKSDFKFSFGVHYYGLSEAEWGEYQKSIRGLGLDKAYAVDLDVGGKRQWVYRNKTDTFIMSNQRPIVVSSLFSGMRLLFDGEPATVMGVFSRAVDAGFAVRAIKAQQCNSRAEQKLALLVELIRSKDVGALVYFNFLDSVEVAYQRLCLEFPGRRVVKLTGGTKNFTHVVASIGPDDLVLMSSVASQSIDMYIPRLIVMECFALVPGKLNQLIGRMTRENSSFRDVFVDFILREGESVDAYFYSKLRLRLKYLSAGQYFNVDSLPVVDCLKNMPPDLIDEAYLKKRLLWNSS
jgi:hypothetical protein